jgi:hypothetical protein
VGEEKKEKTIPAAGACIGRADIRLLAGGTLPVFASVFLSPAS